MENAASASVAVSPVSNPYRVRVIAVEEDPIGLTTLTQMLQRCGYEATAKASPEEALRELRLNPEVFDLVLTVAHIRGAGIDGFALLERLKNRLPVILFSGDEPVETVKRGIQGGACDFLFKPLRDKDMHNIWRHVVQWRRNAVNAPADPRKRRSAGVVPDSGEVGTTKKTKFNWPPELLHASVVRTAHELRGTAGYSPRGIRDLLEAQGIEVTAEEVINHLEIYRRDCPINHLPAMPMASSSQCILSNDYWIQGSSEFYMRSQGATNTNQTSLGNGVPPVGRGILGDERYKQTHVAYIPKNGNLHCNDGNCNGKYSNGYDYHYGNGNGNANASAANANGCHNGSLPSDLAPQADQVMPHGFGNGRGGLIANGNMVSASLPSNLGQKVHQAMPNTCLCQSNMMPSLDNPNPIRQQEFPHISQLSYNDITDGISLSPWPKDDDGDLLRSYLGENEVMMQNTTATGMVQGTQEDCAAGQTSASQPQDISDFFSWESTTGNRADSTSGGTGGATDEVMECVQNEDDIDKFFGC